MCTIRRQVARSHGALNSPLIKVYRYFVALKRARGGGGQHKISKEFLNGRAIYGLLQLTALNNRIVLYDCFKI